MPAPHIMIVRKEIYDPSIEDYIEEQLPTETIKKFGRVSGPSSYRTIASYTGLGYQPREEGGSFDCVGRIIRLGVNARGTCEVYLIDRNGTLDAIVFTASGREFRHGRPIAPLYNVMGTFKVTMGSVNAGTYTAAFELLKRIPGTFTVR